MKQLEAFRNVHFIGIGGSGMSAIASVLLARGFNVSGSDLGANDLTRKLAKAGARIDRGHKAEHVNNADLVVTSTAIRAENPERLEAERLGLPIWRRARVLAEIMHGGRSVAVSGTHGKTTTTSMLGLMVSMADFDPTVLIGGELNDFGGNARCGKGEWVIAEADESDASFLEMNPDRIIVTNIEADHLDFYSGHEAIVETFKQFFGGLRPGGKIIACVDDPTVATLAASGDWPIISFGIDADGADLCATNLSLEGVETTFTPVWRGEPLAEVRLEVPGRHNVIDALAALACGLDMGVPFEPMRQALSIFTGARRRFQVKGRQAGITVVDDYAHHPTEIAATLAAAQSRLQGSGRIVGLFQPHRYSRTQRLAADFGQALQGADVVIIADVYSAGEQPIDGVSGQLVLDEVLASGHKKAFYISSLDDAPAFLIQHLAEGDMLLTMGAGNVYQVGETLLERLKTPEGGTA